MKSSMRSAETFWFSRTMRCGACCMALIAIVFLLGGCGGGGRSQDTVYPLSSQTRALQPGDTWKYDDNRTFTIGAQTIGGQTRLTQTTRIMTYGEAYGTSYTVDIFDQNAQGELVYSGEYGPPFSSLPADAAERVEQNLTTPQTVLFGNWAKGATLSYRLAYDAAGTTEYPYPTERESVSLTVVGTEKIKTALGTFETWKVEGVYTYPGFSDPTRQTLWYAPQIGAYVKARVVMGGVDARHGYDVTLTETNVPLR